MPNSPCRARCLHTSSSCGRRSHRTARCTPPSGSGLGTGRLLVYGSPAGRNGHMVGRRCAARAALSRDLTGTDRHVGLCRSTGHGGHHRRDARGFVSGGCWSLAHCGCSSNRCLRSSQTPGCGPGSQGCNPLFFNEYPQIQMIRSAPLLQPRHECLSAGVLGISRLQGLPVAPPGRGAVDIDTSVQQELRHPPLATVACHPESSGHRDDLRPVAEIAQPVRHGVEWCPGASRVVDESS